jgi:nicotinamide-nucleotide amidase
VAVTSGVAVVSVSAVGANGEVMAVTAALASVGIAVPTRVLVEEDEATLESVLAAGQGFTVIVTGPGGSAGDIVRRVLARAAGARLVLHERMLAALEEHYRRQDRPLPRRAERLALLPQGATVLVAGESEPAWLLETDRGTFVILARGAPLEPVLAQHVVPLAQARGAPRGISLQRTLRTVGLALDEVEERLAPWLGKEGDVAVATVPADGDVWVRLRARGATPSEAADALEAVDAAIGAALGDACYGRDAEALEQVVGRLLAEQKLTVAVAESCTGGLLGHRLTSVPGSSAYFERGVIVYSNRAKEELLGVPEAILRAHGAVSAPCAEAMARRITELAGSACGLAITGIAGPDGGTPAKPVGTVFVGLVAPGTIATRRFRFTGDRASIKWQSSQMALDLLRRRLLES